MTTAPRAPRRGPGRLRGTRPTPVRITFPGKSIISLVIFSGRLLNYLSNIIVETEASVRRRLGRREAVAGHSGQRCGMLINFNIFNDIWTQKNSRNMNWDLENCFLKLFFKIDIFFRRIPLEGVGRPAGVVGGRRRRHPPRVLRPPSLRPETSGTLVKFS